MSRIGNRAEDGQGLAEYALILAVMGAMAVLTILATGDQVRGIYQRNQDAVTSAARTSVSSSTP